MRRTLLVILSVVTLCAPVQGAEWATFSHPDPAFTIRYPADWMRMSADKKALLVLVGPGSGGMGVIVAGAPQGSKKESVDDLLVDLPRIIPARFADYHALRTDRTTMAGRRAIIHYFTGIRNSRRMYAMLAAVTTDTHGFMIFAMTAADSPRLREEINLLQKIIQGFRPGL